MKRHMKHLKRISAPQPQKAQEVAWVQLKDLIASNYTKGGASNMSPLQELWLAAQWDNLLQK